MRATIGGLCKLAAINCPLEAEIENIATSVGYGTIAGGKFMLALGLSMDIGTNTIIPFPLPLPLMLQAFADRQSDISEEESFIDKDMFIAYCKKTAEIMSWMEYFGDVEDNNSTTMTLQGMASKKVIDREAQVWRYSKITFGHDTNVEHYHQDAEKFMRNLSAFIMVGCLVGFVAQPEERNEYDLAANDADDGALARLDIERHGPKADLVPLEQWRSATVFTEPVPVDAVSR